MGVANALSSSAVVDVLDDILFTLGDGADQVLLNRSTVLNANTALTGALIGTPVTPALAANSLIIANATSNGDVLIAGNDGGHSRVAMFFDSSEPNTTLYNVGGTWSAGATTWTIPAVTLGGAVTGNAQTISNANVTVGASRTLDVSAGTLTLAANQISGDKVEGGTINAITITTLSASTINAHALGGTMTLGGNVFAAGADSLQVNTTAASTGFKIVNSYNGAAGVRLDFQSTGRTVPAVNDSVLEILARGNDLAPASKVYSTYLVKIEDATSGAAYGKLEIQLLANNTANTALTLSSAGALWTDASVDTLLYKVSGTQVVGARVVDAKIDDAINAGAWDATTAGVLEACRDALVTHGLVAAA